MLNVLLSVTLAVAPIPKGQSNYDGQITLLVSKKESEVVVLKPTGEVARTVPLKDVKGHISTIRQSRNAEFVILGTTDEQTGETTLFRVDLDQKAKTTKLYQSKTGVETVCLAKDGKSAIFSEYSENLNNPQGDGFVHWTIDTTTGKKTKLDLGSEYKIQDRGQDDDDIIMADLMPTGNIEVQQTAVLSLKTKKTSFVSTNGMNGLCLFGDSKSILINDVRNENGAVFRDLEMFVLGTKKTKSIPKPDKGNQICYSTSPNPNHMVYCLQTASQPVAVYVVNFANNEAKKVYTFKDNEQVIDCDWR